MKNQLTKSSDNSHKEHQWNNQSWGAALFAAAPFLIAMDNLQLDTIRRAIILWSNEGDKVLTPFMGIGSEVYEAMLLNRFGVGFELKDSYFRTAVMNIKKAESEKRQWELF